MRIRIQKTKRYSEYKESFVELFAKKENSRIEIQRKEEYGRLDNSLPEYFSAMAGGLIASSFLVVVSSEMIAYYKLEGLFLVSGIVLGFLWSYSTKVRKRAVSE